MDKQHNWALLGGLRWFLALVVLAAHVAHDQLPWNPLAPLADFGAITAVWAFFFISGYSIAHSISTRPQGFYSRRVDRIYPVFLCCYLVALVPFALAGLGAGLAVAEPPSSMWVLGLNALPLQTVLVPRMLTFGPAWSLAVECCFYALAPWFARCSRRALWAMVAASMLFCTSRQWWGLELNYNDLSPLILLGTGWAWLLGWLIYQERESQTVQRFAIGLACVGYGLVQAENFKFSFITVAATAALLVYQNEVKLSPRAAGWLCYLGELSYPLYLVHIPTIFILKAVWPVANALPYLALPLLAAVALYHGVDKPLRRRAARRLASAPALPLAVAVAP